MESSHKEQPKPVHAATAAEKHAQPQPAAEKPAAPPKAKEEEPAGTQVVKAEGTPAATETDGAKLKAVRNNWEKIRQVIKPKHKSTEGLLNSCKTLTMYKGVLQLGFGSPVLKSKMETEDNLKVTMKAIQQVLGQEIPITCIVVDAKGGPIRPDEDVDADGMVNAALDLGAEIVQKE